MVFPSTTGIVSKTCFVMIPEVSVGFLSTPDIVSKTCFVMIPEVSVGFPLYHWYSISIGANMVLLHVHISVNDSTTFQS